MEITSVTNLLEEGHTPESLLERVLEGFDIEINDRMDTKFYCNCSKERVEKALISIGRKELNELIQEGKEVEMNFDIEINDRMDTKFYCNCSKERVEKALISIGRKELNELIQEGKEVEMNCQEVEMNCHFCNTNYVFSVEELKEILRRGKAR